MLLPEVLVYAIRSRETGRAPFDRALNAEYVDMNGEMFPRRIPTALGAPALIQLTDLPLAAAIRPVNLKHMAFPCVFVVHLETAIPEWTKSRL